MERHFDILDKQEEMLRFEHFTHADALDFGLFMINRAKDLGLCVSISICSADGAILFQYLPDGTNRLNDNWMRRKANTVLLMECSSLKATYNLERNGETLSDNGLSSADYALCGGGFPLRLKDGTMVGAAVASNMFHIADHEFIAGSLREYLGCPDVPAYPYE